MGSVTLASLGLLGEELGSGGQGAVYSLPNSPSPRLVYKAYSPDALAALDTGVLSDMVDLPASLPGRDRHALLTAAAWPRDVVTDGGRVCGFTMALAPKRFHTTIRLLKGPQVRLGQTQLLLNPPDYLDRVELRIDDRFRLELLADIAGTLLLFHRLGLTVGDLSPNNLLYGRTGKPRCHFIDCDAMQLHGRTVLPQVETTDWVVPTGAGAPGSKEGDAYKFALLCVRLFAGDQSTTEPEALRRAGEGVHSLAVRALSGDASSRPGLDKWENQLRAAVERAAAGPPLAAPPTAKVASAPPRTTVPATITVPVPPVSVPVPRPRTPGSGLFMPQPAFRRLGGLTRLGRRLTAMRKRSVVRLAVLSLLVGYAVTHTAQVESWARRVSTVISGGNQAEARAQAGRIADLLDSSAPVRTKVKNAVTSLAACKNVKASVTDLAVASTNRRHALAAATRLQVTKLSDGAAMKTELVSAFKHSQAADDAYRSWGLKLSKHGCRKSVRNGPDRGRGDRESAASTKAKKRFVELWNVVGPRYGQKTVAYQNI